MLAVCSAVPSFPSYSQISFHGGTRVFYPLQKAIEDRDIIEDSFFGLKNGIRMQDMSFTTHATKFMHSLVVERPDQSGSDSSIVAPFPNEIDNIVHDFPNNFIDKPENLSLSVGERIGLHPLNHDLTYMGSSNVSGPGILHVDLGSDITEGITSSVNVEISSTASPFSDEIKSLPDYLITASPFSDEIKSLPDSLIQSSSVSLEVTSSDSFAANDMSSTIPGSTESLDLKTSTENFLSGVSKSLDLSIGRAEGAVENTYNSAVSVFSNTVQSVTKSMDSAVSSLFSSVGNYKEQTSNGYTGFSTELEKNIYKTEIVATDILRRAIVIVEDSLFNAAKFVVYSYGSAKSLLPPDFRNALNLSEENAMHILRPFGDAFQQVYVTIEGFEKNLGLDPNDPIVSFILFLGSSATIGISYWFFTHGGYSGDLTPESTFELLKSDDKAVLIDVRPEDLRDRDGVPDLRRGARSKYAYVTLPELDGSLRKLLKGGKDIDDSLIAVVIRNLKIVKDGSKVIVMDAGENRSKAIARSLKKLGVKNPYLVQGGFQSWVRKGLRIKELKPETTLTVLNEEAEAILEDIRPTPTLAIGYGLSIIAAGYVLLEWEKTLQVIAILGLGQTLYKRFTSYEDSQDFKQDIRFLLTPVRLGIQAVSWAAGKLEPNKVGLPTSPSSSAVQNRVLQAAAKHEAQPSDADENLDLSEA